MLQTLKLAGMSLLLAVSAAGCASEVEPGPDESNLTSLKSAPDSHPCDTDSNTANINWSKLEYSQGKVSVSKETALAKLKNVQTLVDGKLFQSVDAAKGTAKLKRGVSARYSFTATTSGARIEAYQADAPTKKVVAEFAVKDFGSNGVYIAVRITSTLGSSWVNDCDIAGEVFNVAVAVAANVSKR